MNIYDYEDYRAFLADWIAGQPGGGRGTLKKWAGECRVHSTLLSQIMAAKKDMSLELAERISRVIGLSESEFDYLSLLVLHARAGTSTLKAQFKRRILSEQKKAKSIGARLNVGNELSEEAKARFYSSWLYSGIRNLSATPGFGSVEALAARLSLPRTTVLEILHFLVEAGLCKQENGRLVAGTRRTHVDAQSPHVQQHHKNWRLLGIQQMAQRRDEHLFFTFPMSISEADAEKIRRLLPSFVESIHKIVGATEAETVRCLNIDFFDY